MSRCRSGGLSRGDLRGLLVVLFVLALAASAAAEESHLQAEEVEIFLRGGQVKTVPIELGSDPREDLNLWARLEALPEAWPEKDLRIEIVSDEIGPGAHGRTLVVRVGVAKVSHGTQLIHTSSGLANDPGQPAGWKILG